MNIIAYIQTLIRMHQIAVDQSAPEYNRCFAIIFRSLFQINVNINNNETTKFFKEVSDKIMIIYFHRIIQLMDNKIDPVESRSDYDELFAMVRDINHSIKTNETPSHVAHQITEQLSIY